MQIPRSHPRLSEAESQGLGWELFRLKVFPSDSGAAAWRLMRDYSLGADQTSLVLGNFKE